MKHLSHFEEVEPGDKIYTVDDVHLTIGGPIYCLAGTTLIVQEVFPKALKACTEGGTLAEQVKGGKHKGKLSVAVGHIFVGEHALQSLRLVSKKDLHSMQNDSRKDGKTNKTKKQK